MNEIREKIKENLKRESFDLIVIGGGATGSGIALDAASRGLKTALVEKGDFSSGTSSRSTKLVHGGVRYLEDAVLHFDKTQYNLVRDALKERYNLLNNSKYLAWRLNLVTPLYKAYEMPYIYAGLSLYDVLSGKKRLGASRILGKRKIHSYNDCIKKEGLKGGVLYYDGQFHDARMNIALIKTAYKFGAKPCNYIEVVNLIKKGGMVGGVKVKDVLTGDTFDINGKVVVNATGPYLDNIRKLDDPNTEDMLKVSSGIHIVIDASYTKKGFGLMIPKTEDGRVLFVLPWNGNTLVGTTDEEATLEDHPTVKKKDVNYLLKHVNNYFDMKITEKDIKSKWSGLRPLVKDPNKSDTAKLSRDHVIEASPSGLLTIGGGKWTTYRKMAQDLVDKAIEYARLTPHSYCYTDRIFVDGYDPVNEDLKKQSSYNFLDKKEFDFLYKRYGSNLNKILELNNGQLNMLYEDYPIFEEEIKYQIREEFAARAEDVIIRRTMLALVDINGAKEIAEKVVEIMSEELNWSKRRKEEEQKILEDRLNISI
ncbi:MAG: FAD-dependent oxidoreductase [Deferribacterota bacterium]|nr:FAD-dependent oxidoreductase [Deferribacterota bacterium]